MAEASVAWATYEDVVTSVLQQMAAEFGLPPFAGKQKARGKATHWEIEAKGISANGELFLIVACRWHKTASLSQAAMGGLAFRIQDPVAREGILVSPLSLHEGAEKIAGADTMQTVRLDATSACAEALPTFLNQVRSGLADTASASETMPDSHRGDGTRQP